jgi:uncharacterized protein with GYD domain
MPKYLWSASYTPDGVKGLMQEGGSRRRDTVSKAIESGGGRMEGFYFAFGETDVFVIAEMPDAAAAAAAAMVINASGAVRLRTTVLLTPEEIDAATHKSVAYSPPGG